MWAVYYQSALLLISLIYVSFKNPEYRVAWCALALWLPLCMIAQDITGETLAPIFGIAIAASLCPLAIYAARIGKTSVGLWVYLVFILSMIGDLIFFLNNRIGSEAITDKTFQHLGGLLFCVGILSLFWDDLKRLVRKSESLFDYLRNRDSRVHNHGAFHRSFNSNNRDSFDR